MTTTSQRQWLEQIPLKRYNTWRVGGPAEVLYRPADLEDLQRSLQEYSKIYSDIHWLGLGSNVLIRDGGIQGLVILTNGGLMALHVDKHTETLRAEAGVACAKVAKYAAKQGLTGGEFLAGIPGTMGGALLMNAGAYGGATWEIVEAVETINRQGEIKILPAQSFKVGYRHINGLAQDEWFVAAHLKLTPTRVDIAQANIKQLLQKRSLEQPIGLPSCGSVFKNPQGNHAARLIEASGLKGTQHGRVRVSEKHANFIVHDGEASALEIEELMQHIQEVVYEKHQIKLEPEVKLLGIK